jgi:hypothetical protein
VGSGLPPGLRYTNDRALIVRVARQKGLTDKQILKALVANEYGEAARRGIIRDWAEALGLTEKEALQVAKEEGLIG